MSPTNFERLMVFFGYPADDQKHKTLQLVLCEGVTQAEACRRTGYNPSQFSPVYKRVRRDIQRVKDLTGVDVCA